MTPGATPGAVSITNGVAKLSVPKQMLVGADPHRPGGPEAFGPHAPHVRSQASHAGVVYMKITTVDGRSVMYSPNTQLGGEQGVDTMATHNVLTGTVRLNDDAGEKPTSTGTRCSLRPATPRSRP